MCVSVCEILTGKMSRSSKVLYVGNLPGDVREREVEDIFYKVLLLFVLLIVIHNLYRTCVNLKCYVCVTSGSTLLCRGYLC